MISREPGKIKIVRPARKAELISAAVFDDLFKNLLGDIFDIHVRSLIPWCTGVLGPVDSPHSYDEAAASFFNETRDFDFFCPGYECIPLTPLFMAFRNSSKADIRLLFIAHAPGVYGLEWALLRPLLLPGDVIVAPSQSGKETIEFLCPELSPFIKVVHHPMPLLPRIPRSNDATADSSRIVSIGNIYEKKLIHRQIEAVAILRKQGYNGLTMDIAGPVTQPRSTEPLPYVRTLRAKIQRLKLDRHVRLVGPVYGEEAKARFLAGAKMLVYLSVSVEEAYPKSSIEALGLGIPVVGSRWNGFSETVGKAGILVPVHAVGGGHVDVAAGDVAEAIKRILAGPPSVGTCMDQAQTFTPGPIKERYARILQAALKDHPTREITVDTYRESKHRAAPSRGLLAQVAALKPFLWREIITSYPEYAVIMRKRWQGDSVGKKCRAERLHEMVLLSGRKAVQNFLAKLPVAEWLKTTGPATNKRATKRPGDFLARIAGAICAEATQASKEICLAILREENRRDLFEQGLSDLELAGEPSPSLRYLQIEGELMRGSPAGAFELFNDAHDINVMKEHQAVHLRQMARICREWQKPELALPWLRKWLAQFPDSPDSGPVWADRSLNASLSGIEWLPEAKDSLVRARNLLGPIPLIMELAHHIDVTAAGGLLFKDTAS
jgi:glycosyltransferase involved in cell wall biosynthesis